MVFQGLDFVRENQHSKVVTALSKLTFIASVLPIPDDFIKSVNKQIVDLICRKNPKIKKTTMIGEKRRGVRNT